MLQIRNDVPLRELTTFKIGGSAQFYTEVRNAEELKDAVDWARDQGVKMCVLAGASNVLIPDGGLKALVIHIVEGAHAFEGKSLTADAGCNLLSLIRTASSNGFGGWEKLAGIPGTIGGAVRGNAGAFGTEIKDVAVSIRALNAATGEQKTFSNAESDFSYRHSYFKDHPEWLVTSATVELRQVNADESARLIEETIVEREKRHLQNVRAAGSFFMNPIAPRNIIDMFEAEKGVKSRENRVPAGWLIEKAGLKGHTVGDAQASMQHPNYLVNTGNATAHDVRNLAQLIKLEVYAQFGVELHEEAALL
ncbi:MAG: UDP-N-acetylmuramate dehydrogenase [Candidatus Paceibacterota bacterium]